MQLAVFRAAAAEREGGLLTFHLSDSNRAIRVIRDSNRATPDAQW